MSNELNQQASCWAIIPAAGTSQRMQTDRPKQYLPLLSSTVIEASVACFLQHSQIMGIVVALHVEDQFWNSLSIANQTKIDVVTGGASRAHSVSNALAKLQEKSEPNDFVLVHDAARPCLRYSDLDLLITSLIEDEVGGILATPMHDTVKLSGNENGVASVKGTLDRRQIWRALTPQMFRIGKLRQALDHCLGNNIEITDEASAIEALDFRVKLVEGRSDNIKVTRQEDLKQAAFILETASDVINR